jgi:4-hydroxybutyryl-CoA dehydratase/vinylacetyl-CoA-Delta-isomerase
MGLRTADEYSASLKDGRTLYYHGKKVDDVTADPELAVAVENARLDFLMGHDPKHRDLAVATDEESGEDYSAYYKIPRNADDLIARSRLIELGTEICSSIPALIKEIGSDALFALLRVCDGESLEKVRAFYQQCWQEDLAIAVAQTDVKGDRAKGPSAQKDPDHYLRVVEESPEGIVVRGAKAHTSASANANYLITLPTRAMGPDDADWAVSFAVPVNAPGLSLYISAYSGGDRNPFDHPLSYRTKMLETLTVFDDVFIPWERVFFCRKPEMAAPAALTFVEYHRFTAVSYKLPLIDAMVGAAATIAEMNGVMKAGHIRDKLTHLITWGETVRGLTDLAAIRCRIGQDDIAYPDPLTTNMAKYTFATGYHQALAIVQECAGGLLVTGPGNEDWQSPEVRPVLEKFFSAAAPAEPRLRMMNLINDMTTRDFGGYHAVLAIHAEGSVEAEKMQIYRAYDPTTALRRARQFAGIGSDDSAE